MHQEIPDLATQTEVLLTPIHARNDLQGLEAAEGLVMGVTCGVKQAA